jgi:hypothetical protein
VKPRDEVEIRLRRSALRGNSTDLPDAIQMILRLEVDLQERTPTQWIDYFRPVAAGRNRPLLRQIDSRKVGGRDKHKTACIAASASSV